MQNIFSLMADHSAFIKYTLNKLNQLHNFFSSQAEENIMEYPNTEEKLWNSLPKIYN